jgi:hypothetical protein
VIAPAAMLALCLALAPGVAGAQDTAAAAPGDSAPARSAETNDTATLAQFLAGGAIGLAAHEAGHVLAGTFLGAGPGVKAISYGPLPFFAITHESVSAGREYTIAASGFFVQHATSEWLLSTRPSLRYQRAAVAKGVLAFNVLTSTVYAAAAFGQFGPPERDTRAMADALGLDEPWVGAMVLAPAALDAWRYVRPESKWAPWVSRALKAGAVVAVFRAAR